MRSASPSFQPDRPGSPGFQLGEFAGFDTLTPVAVGLLEVVLTLDATTRGPRLGGGGVRARRRRIPYRAEGKLEVVLSLDARVRFSDAIERDDEEVLLLIGWDDPPTWPWGRRRRGDEKAALIALIEADDALVAQRRERGG
jgi:hypothetical protein